MAQRTLTASVALCLVALPAGWAASSSLAAPASSTPSASSSSPSSTLGGSSTSSPTSPSTTAQPPTGSLHAEQPLRLHLDAKGAIDQGALPQGESLFTTGELKQVLPTLTSSNGADDTITLDLPGESSDERSRLLVTMKRFGKKEDITQAWQAEKKLHETRSAHDHGLYTFYRPGEHDVDDAFTDGTTTHVLFSDGDAAGEIWFSGIGFGHLADTHARSRTAYTSSITPKLIELIGAKAAAGHQAPTPSSTASPSSRPSPSSSATHPA